jgi:hypothetical protein
MTKCDGRQVLFAKRILTMKIRSDNISYVEKEAEVGLTPTTDREVLLLLSYSAIGLIVKDRMTSEAQERRQYFNIAEGLF